MEAEQKKKVLPSAGGRNILITSALPYVNNKPHLGNLIGAVLSADAFARYCRLRGWNTLFVAGTDEYGTATETKARKEGRTPREICDEFHRVHTAVYEWFGASFDHWGRTSTEEHTKITQEIFLDLYHAGFVEEDIVRQWYCEKDDMFLADRYVEGDCPDCGFTGARGDQCDKCGHLVDAIELGNAYCTVCNNSPIIKESKHLFLNLPKLTPKLKEWVKGREKHWSKNAKAIFRALLDKGLPRRCITRDLKWGVPVPLEGWEDKVFYVWFDAPIGYLSITAEYTEEWRRWWQPKEEDADLNVELYQFMGKDNAPFHTVIFPATLLGTGKNWTTITNLSTTEFLNYEGGKFSKSRNVGVFGTDAMEEEFPPHVWRYYLFTNRPEQLDSEFLWEDFVSKVNTELLAKVGNFVYRLLTLASKACDGKVPARGEWNEEDQKFIANIEKKMTAYIKRMDGIQLKAGLKSAMGVVEAINKYMTKQKPWAVAKEDPQRANTVLYTLLNSIKLLAVLFEPFMPSFSAALLQQLGTPDAKLQLPGPAWSFDLEEGQVLAEPEVLVPLIEGERISEWWDKYGSAQLTTITLELRVGEVQSVEEHPQAGSRYVLKVDAGEKDPRSIVARIQEFYTPEELKGKKVVLLANLKPAKFGGVLSEGMLLGVTDEDGNYGLVVPDAATADKVQPGFRVMPEGWTCKAASKLTFKAFAAEKLYSKDAEHRIWWDSVKKRPNFKKQPKKSPKGEGKKKAAPKAKVGEEEPEEIVPLELFATDAVGNTYALTVDKVKGNGKVH